MTLQTPPSPSAQLLDFAPVPLRHRSDGWTPDRQRQFIAALAAMGSVRGACRVVGMSHRHAYDLRFHPDGGEFCAAWDSALANGLALMEDAACDRAINGEVTPIMYKDEQVGERVRYDNRLLMFLLRARKPEVYGRGLQSPEPPRPGSDLYNQWEAEWQKRKEAEKAQADSNAKSLSNKLRSIRERMREGFEQRGLADKIVPLDPRSASVIESTVYEHMAQAKAIAEKLAKLGFPPQELKALHEKLAHYEAQAGNPPPKNWNYLEDEGCLKEEAGPSEAPQPHHGTQSNSYNDCNSNA